MYFIIIKQEMSMSTLANSYNNSYNNSEDYFVYHRPLGKKIQGYYPHVSWSDIVLQHVPVETTILSSIENEEIHYTLRQASLKDSSSPSHVGYHSTQKDIQETSLTQDIQKGSKPRHIKGMKHTHSHLHRRRMIPKHTKNTYTSKPKCHEKIHRCKYAKHML